MSTHVGQGSCVIPGLISPVDFMTTWCLGPSVFLCSGCNDKQGTTTWVANTKEIYCLFSGG